MFPKLKYCDEDATKFTTGRPFWLFVTNVGLPEDVPMYPFGLLSTHVLMFDPELNVIELESAPSSHSAHPGILRGSNFELRLANPSIVYLEQNIPQH
jgi:hypothetical protein